MVLNRRSQLEELPYTAEEQQCIREAINRKYRDVSQSADGMFSYQTGKEGAIALGYSPTIVNKLPSEMLNSFCGVGNPFSISSISPGSAVLDVGCGAGFDLLVAREIVGDSGKVCGIDLTEEMIRKAYVLLRQFGDRNISVQHVLSEEIPYPDEHFDHVISNGVFNLSPSKLTLFREILRVLKPNGGLQFADVCALEQKVPDRSSSADDWAQ